MYILLGSHGTGKSSLTKKIKKYFKNFYITDGFSRPIKLAKEKTELNSQQEQIIINELTCWAFENYLEQGNVITTRSPIDTIVYTQYYQPTISTQEIEDLFVAKKDQIQGIFYLPIEFELKNDGVRFLNEEDQKNIDKLMLEFINKHNLKIHTLKGDLNSRVSQMIDIIVKN